MSCASKKGGLLITIAICKAAPTHLLPVASIWIILLPAAAKTPVVEASTRAARVVPNVAVLPVSTIGNAATARTVTSRRARWRTVASRWRTVTSRWRAVAAAASHVAVLAVPAVGNAAGLVAAAGAVAAGSKLPRRGWVAAPNWRAPTAFADHLKPRIVHTLQTVGESAPLAGSFPSRTQRSTGRCAEEVLSKPGSSKHGLTGWTCTSILIDFFTIVTIFTIFIIVTIITIVTIVIVIIKSWLGETGWYLGSASKSNQAESKSCLHPSFIGYHLLKEHISPCHPYHPAGGIKTQYMDHPWKVQPIATFHYKCISLSILTFTIIIICFQWKLHVSGVDVLNTKHRKNSLLLLCDFYLTLRCLSRHGDLELT